MMSWESLSILDVSSMGEIRSFNNWLTFEEARLLVQDEQIGSRDQYYRWWVYNRPGQIPKYPYNVWKKEWKGWNDFLGNANKFKGVKRTYQPYEDAVRFVHSLKLRSQAMWFEYIRENGLPDGIPSRAELVYRDKWVSWNHWLGNKLAARVEAQQSMSDNYGLLYIIHLSGRPANIFKIGTIAGREALLQLKEPHTVVRLFKMEKGYDWEACAAQFGSRWWENEKEWVMGNVHEFLFELSNDLLFA